MNIDHPIFIGPHYTTDIINLESASLDDRISLFEDRLRGYYTTPSRLLLNIYENSAFLVLLVVSMCVELLEIFNQGESSNKKSKRFFKSGFRRIFQPRRPNNIPENQFEKDVDKSLEELYIQLRCGLIHTGTTRSKVILTNQDKDPIKIDFNPNTKKVEQIKINPVSSLLSIDFFLSEYCTNLRNHSNDDLRQKFNKAWNSLIEEE